MTFRATCRDACTDEEHKLEFSNDTHGCVVTIGGQSVIIDVSGSAISVYFANENGEVTDGPAASADIPTAAKTQTEPQSN